MIKDYKATIIGLIFSLGCFILYYTFLFPILTIIPLPYLIDIIFNSIFTKQNDYSITGIAHS